MAHLVRRLVEARAVAGVKLEAIHLPDEVLNSEGILLRGATGLSLVEQSLDQRLR